MDHLERLEHQVEGFYDAVQDLDAAVPSCPGWRVCDLIHHLGSIHRWFARIAEEGWTTRPSAPEPDDRPDAEDRRVLAWASGQSERLLAALDELDPEAPRWNFSRAPHVGRFIPRRMHHETTVHRWDLECAHGQPAPIPADTAADGALEYLEVYVPLRGEWPGDDTRIRVDTGHLPPVDLMLPTGEVPTVAGADPDDEPDVVLSGDPQQVLLALWDRVPLSTVHVAGRGDALAELRRFAVS